MDTLVLCRDCKFYTLRSSACLRYPPVVVVLPDASNRLSAHSEFPTVAPHDTCGEWQGGER
jgi:hypothetical protein